MKNLLYAKALEYQKNKLWKELWDTDLFAVKHSDGKIGYCCILGHDGEFIALVDYVGAASLDTLRAIFDFDKAASDAERFAIAHGQNSIVCSFLPRDELSEDVFEELETYFKENNLKITGKKKLFPIFEKHIPYHVPFLISSKADMLHMLEALEAAIQLKDFLHSESASGFGIVNNDPENMLIPIMEKKGDDFSWDSVKLPKQQSIQYQIPDSFNEILIHDVLKAKKNSAEWYCDFFVVPAPVEIQKTTNRKNGPQYFYPYLQMVVEKKSGIILGSELHQNPDDYGRLFMQSLLKTMQENGRPRKILVRNEQLSEFYAPLAQQLSTPIAKEHDCTALYGGDIRIYYG